MKLSSIVLLVFFAGLISCGSPQDTPSGEDETNTNTSEIITDGTRDNFWGRRDRSGDRDENGHWDDDGYYIPNGMEEIFESIDNAEPIGTTVEMEDDCPDPCPFTEPLPHPDDVPDAPD